MKPTLPMIAIILVSANVLFAIELSGTNTYAPKDPKVEFPDEKQQTLIKDRASSKIKSAEAMRQYQADNEALIKALDFFYSEKHANKLDGKSQAKLENEINFLLKTVKEDQSALIDLLNKYHAALSKEIKGAEQDAAANP